MSLEFWFLDAVQKSMRSAGTMFSVDRVAGTLLLSLASFGTAQAEEITDSTHSSCTVSPRIHSAAHFPFTGALLNENTVVDVNLSCEREPFGFFVFQSIDLVDRRSFANYLQPGVFASLDVQPKLHLRTIFGYVFSQTEGFRDPASDYYALAMANWSLSKRLRLENSLQFYDFSNDTKMADRFLLEWLTERFRASLYLWRRVVLGKHRSSTSAGVSITVPLTPFGERGRVELTSSYMGYLSDDKPDFALQNGLFFTIAIPIRLN